MTSKLRPQPPEARKLEVFPDFPPRDDMQNTLYLHRRSLMEALAEHLGNYDTTLVLGEVPVRWTPSQTRGHRIPDLLVAFNIDREQAEYQNGYSIQDLGKPPDFVLEVASVRTADNDVIGKRLDYANFGIPEYWRFDPTGGQRHDAPMAGDRLENGAYQPIEIIEIEPQHLHGHSDALNLDLCWNHGELRWYDPSTGQHLMTLAEERQARAAAEERANTEREALAAAEARIRELEEELKNREEELTARGSRPQLTARAVPETLRSRRRSQPPGAMAVMVWMWDCLLSPMAKGATTGDCSPAARRRSSAARHSAGLPTTATWSCISRVMASEARATSPAARASAASAISSPKPVSTKKLR